MFFKVETKIQSCAYYSTVKVQYNAVKSSHSMPPQNMSHWRKDTFEPKEIDNP